MTWTRSRPNYGSAWVRLRYQVLADEPTCRSCGAASTEVDHVKAKSIGGTDARSNLRALCGPCHHEKTARDDAHPHLRPREPHPGTKRGMQ